MAVGVSVIRAMTLDDLAEVVALERAEQPKPWSEGVFRDELDQENRIYLVVGSPTVGYGGMMVVGDEAHVTTLLISREHRHRGLGRELLVALIEKSIDSGARHVTLEVRAANDAARALYSSVGLAPVGYRPRYYGDDDALIMWAHDIDHPDYLESLR